MTEIEDLPSWLSVQTEGFRLTLLIQAGAKKNDVVGVHNGCLKLKIAAPAVEGAANAAIVNFLAELLQVRRSQIHFLQGEFAKRKVVEVTGQFKHKGTSQENAPWRRLAEML